MTTRMLSLAALALPVLFAAACGVAPSSDEGAEETIELLDDGLTATCHWESLGGGTSCKTTADWKANAWSRCQAQGQMLTNYSVATSCATGAYRSVTFQCCNQRCTSQTVGGTTSCKTGASWKSYATSLCAAQGKHLVDYQLTVACDGGYRYITFQCCP